MKAIEEYSLEELKAQLKKKENAQKAEQAKKERLYQNERDSYVTDAVAAMKELSEKMSEFKHLAIQKGNELHRQMFDIFNKQEKDLKQFSLISKDGLSKIIIERQERQELDETAIVAIEAIKDVFKRKFSGRNQTMYKILDGILMKNRKGDYDERLVAKLRKYEQDIDDVEFSEALDRLSASYNVIGSATYLRAYTFNVELNRWDDIPMQFSSL